MTAVALLKNSFAPACANALLQRESHPLSIHKATVVAIRTTRLTANPLAPWRHRHRRTTPATANLSNLYRPWVVSCPEYCPDFLRKTSHSFVTHRIAKRSDLARRSLKEKIKLPMERTITLQHSLEAGMMLPPAHITCQRGRDETEPRRIPDELASLAHPQIDDSIETRSSRSASTTSRSTNRLTLTLPIAPPTPLPSRPTPASTTATSFPPTPLDTPTLKSPIVDPTDLITAIAAQERRVLELREELSAAESDLAKLKKQWATHEAYKKRGDRRNVHSLSSINTAIDLRDEGLLRRSAEIDRRKALLMGQQNTPERNRRRVFDGGHTRTLSLLSPTKPDDGFSDINSPKPTHEANDRSSVERYTSMTPAQLAKRSSWTPRSVNQPGGVKQIAQDLRVGLWTFVEDLRQATVGDEPITGQGQYMRGVDGNMRSTLDGGASRSSSQSAVDQDTIRVSASHNSRARVTSAFDSTPTATRTTKEGHQQKQENEAAADALARPKPALSRSKTVGSKPTKRFSWTPLTMDSYDDSDWSNWDSTSTPGRWSGTTVNGDIIPTIPEKRDESDTPL